MPVEDLQGGPYECLPPGHPLAYARAHAPCTRRCVAHLSPSLPPRGACSVTLQEEQQEQLQRELRLAETKRRELMALEYDCRADVERTEVMVRYSLQEDEVTTLANVRHAERQQKEQERCLQLERQYAEERERRLQRKHEHEQEEYHALEHTKRDGIQRLELAARCVRRGSYGAVRFVGLVSYDYEGVRFAFRAVVWGPDTFRFSKTTPGAGGYFPNCRRLPPSPCEVTTNRWRRLAINRRR